MRVADLVPNFANIGLLEQDSEQDLMETDLYVFRESTGELPGFTGRLANLIGDAELNPSTANHFSIAPGKHTEVIQLPNAALSTTAAHQYLHVVGRELNAMPDAPDFGADPIGEFPSVWAT